MGVTEGVKSLAALQNVRVVIPGWGCAVTVDLSSCTHFLPSLLLMEPGGGWAARRWFLQVRIHSGYFCEDGLQAVTENAAVCSNFNRFVFNPGESFLVKMPGSILEKCIV